MSRNLSSTTAILTNPALALSFPALTFDAWCHMKERKGTPIEPAQLDRLAQLHPQSEDVVEEPSTWTQVWAALCRAGNLPTPLARVGADTPPDRIPLPDDITADLEAIRARNDLARRLGRAPSGGGDAA